MAAMAFVIWIPRDRVKTLHWCFHTKGRLTGPVTRDPGIVMLGSPLTELKIFHVIVFTGPAKKIGLRTNLLTCKLSIFYLNDKKVRIAT